MTRGVRRNRKPVDKLNGYDSREAMWEVIRQVKSFTVRLLHQETTLEISSVRDYVTGLTRAGYLEVNKVENPVVFDLIKDVGVDAPRVRRDGGLVTQGQGRINMWRTMRIIKKFTARELAINSSTSTCTVKESTAKDYIKHLARAGYLRHLKGGVYFFKPHMFSGPKPPMVQRVKRVWDQNLKKIMWSEDGGGPDDR